MTSSTTKRANNSLNYRQKHLLASWCERNSELINTMSYGNLARNAEKELMFNVTDSNVISAIEAAVIEISSKSREGKNQNDRFTRLCRELKKICDANGISYSEELTRLINRK